MAQFRSKPKIVEAFQWTGDEDQREDPVWIVNAIRNGDVVFRKNFDEGCVELRMTTIQGQWVYAKPGEWIIREPVEGRFYPCADDVFRANYEPVE
jgi:hypothetical protein